MDVRRLQAFCKVYTLRSFSKAGDELLLSQPTISAHVLALEEELGTQLFDRLGRSVLPTQAGDVLFRYGQAVFAELDHARADILALSQRVAGELIIGGSTIPAHYIIPRLVTGFRKAHPEVRLQLRVGDSRDISEMVLTGDVHVGLVGSASSHADLVCQPFLEDDLLLVAPLTLPAVDLAGENWRSLLLSLPWVMRESGSGTQLALIQAFIAAGLDIRAITPELVVHSSLAVLECVEAGLGVAVVSHLAAKPYIKRGTVRVQDIPGLVIRRQFVTVHHARRYQFPALRAFLGACCVK
jgi:LysR family transcriptional regulator, transcriptional activator of the cysJI operon